MDGYEWRIINDELQVERAIAYCLKEEEASVSI